VMLERPAELAGAVRGFLEGALQTTS